MIFWLIGMSTQCQEMIEFASIIRKKFVLKSGAVWLCFRRQKRYRKKEEEYLQQNDCMQKQDPNTRSKHKKV